MEQADVKRVIEAVLLVFSQPVALKRLAELMPDVEPAHIRAAVQTLNTEYDSGGRAFQIQEVAGGYQFMTRQEFAPWVRTALQSPRPDAVSAATMETLAIIAYRQPITKAEIETVRGVDVTASLETLLERRFVRIVGRRETPGRPFLYGTTPEFLRHFGLKSIEALPPMATPTIPELATEAQHSAGRGSPDAEGGGKPQVAPAAASDAT